MWAFDRTRHQPWKDCIPVVAFGPNHFAFSLWGAGDLVSETVCLCPPGRGLSLPRDWKWRIGGDQPARCTRGKILQRGRWDKRAEIKPQNTCNTQHPFLNLCMHIDARIDSDCFNCDFSRLCVNWPRSQNPSGDIEWAEGARAVWDHDSRGVR